MVEGMYFIVKKRTHSGTGRLCFFSISKKIFKNAVERNKLKRRIRAIIKKHDLKGKEVFIIPKKTVKKASFSDIEKDLSPLL